MTNKVYIAIAFAIIAIGALIIWERQKTGETSDQVQNADDVFTFEVGAPYAEAKKILATHSWTPYIPDSFESAGDAAFPEIGQCGTGYDAVCHANFIKGIVTRGLYIQLQDTGNNAVWTVIGSDAL